MKKNNISFYSTLRDQVKTGDKIEWRTHSLLGSTIRLFSGQKVNHTSLALSLAGHNGFTGEHNFILEANEDGIEAKLLSRRLEQFDGEVWWSPLLPKYDVCRDQIAQWALLQEGIKYDYGSLFRNAIGRVSADARKLFCSEFYFLSLKHAGILNGDKAPRPGEFEKFKLHFPAIKIL